MRKYRIRENSILDNLIKAIPAAVILTLVIVMAGLGNHFIDGIGV
jgi:hypothetical protein